MSVWGQLGRGHVCMQEVWAMVQGHHCCPGSPGIWVRCMGLVRHSMASAPRHLGFSLGLGAPLYSFHVQDD